MGRIATLNPTAGFLKANAEVVHLRNLRPLGGVSEAEAADVVSVERRRTLLAEISRNAEVGGHAGLEWIKVGNFLARQFGARPFA
ncbi:MAG: hypothetical protein EOO81_11630 [Oxalobacteraceae bacterium]|nr:MAG: hypothetical protein EOO81_11630 [Oxalobacteraceae bacterium]